ncbi:unnamed protein product, partial [Brassica napus]
MESSGSEMETELDESDEDGRIEPIPGDREDKPACWFNFQGLIRMIYEVVDRERMRTL